jgi:methyl-accepting chemotaxis protein
MNQELLYKLRKKNLQYFSRISTGLTVLMTGLYCISLSIEVFMQHIVAVGVLIGLALISVIAHLIIFNIQNNKCYNILLDESISVDDKALAVRTFLFRGVVIIMSSHFVSTFFVLATAYQVNILITVFQILLFSTIAIFFANLEGGLFYYFEKIAYFDIIDFIPVKPLAISGKLIIPLACIIFTLLNVLCAIYYRINFISVTNAYNEKMDVFIDNHNDLIDSLIGEILAELKGYSVSSEMQSQDPAQMRAFVRRINRSRHSSIEMLIAITKEGQGYTSFGGEENFSAQPFYSIPLSTGKSYFSDPHTSMLTGKNVLTLSFPVTRNNEVVGIMAATILVDTIESLFSEISTSALLRVWLINTEGKIMIHSDRSLVGMTVGKSLFVSSDGETTKDIEQILTAKDRVPFEYLFNDTAVMGFKERNESTGWSFIIAEDLSVFLDDLKITIIYMIIIINGLGILIAIPSFFITKQISSSITSSTSVISLLSDGNLTVDKIEAFPDEMGYLLKEFDEFVVKLQSIISRAAETSTLLESSSEELADASRSLSDGAQNRAASVEEATAAIEEVTSSVEQISNSAEAQMNLASLTYSSMEQLREDIGTVLKYTVDAMDTANKTTKQAQIGNKMMQDTISGMNNIDSSTQQIADMISIITDISDQVNLLALNASIEAARAGEHGKGFAIVAEEISKLADETATTAKSITDLVKIGLKEVATGRKFVDNTKNSFDNIISNIRETELLVKSITESAKQQFSSSEKVLADTKSVLEMAEAINVATNEQMITNQEMSKTIEQINQGTLSEAARSEEIASSAADINSQAVALKEDIKFFKL